MTWNDHPEAQALAQRRHAKTPRRCDARARLRAAREEASSTTPTPTQVQRISATSRDLTQRLSQPTYRLVPSDYGPAPAIRGENKQVSLGQRGSPAHDWAHPPPDTAHDEAIAQLLGWRRVA